MFNNDLCDRSCFCKRCTVPLSCIECPIRNVKINCLFNAGGVNYTNVETSRQKIAKLRLMSKRNNKLLTEFCRKNCCSPDVIRQILLSKVSHQNSCENQRDPFNQKHNRFPNIFGTQSTEQPLDEDEDDVFTRNLLNQLFDDTYARNDQAEKKTHEELDQNWVDNLYELYSAVAGPVALEQHKITEEQMRRLQMQYDLKSEEDQSKSKRAESFSKKPHKTRPSKSAVHSKLDPKKRTDYKDNPIRLSYYEPFSRNKRETWTDTKVKQFVPTITAKADQAMHRLSDAEDTFLHMSLAKTSFKREYDNRPLVGQNFGYGDGNAHGKKRSSYHSIR